MIGYIGSVVVVIVRAWRVGAIIAAGGFVPWAFGISEAIALVTTCYALVYGRVDASVAGLLVPVLHLSALLYDVSSPRLGPEWAAGFYLPLVFLQMLLRLRMGWSCTVGVPVFVNLLQRWPYSMIRHPLAVLEITLGWLVYMWVPSSWNLLAFALHCWSCQLIVIIEERFLMTHDGYQQYAARVRWRMLPGIW
jgi:protein-S-isoprenylcysteine O-methyltransferase Ste14